MILRHQEPILDRELADLGKRTTFISKLLGQADSLKPSLVDIYTISVVECLVLIDYDEENPLYLLDLGGTILILFGQWMFQDTLCVQDEVFEAWNIEGSFFQNFSLRCLAERGIVFQLDVKDASFVQARRLPSRVTFTRLRECQFIKGTGETLITDLKKAGLIE